MTPIEFRRHIHANPELSFEEYNTAAFIENTLAQCGIETYRIAGTGVIAKIEGLGNTKRAVVLRADIDALPIVEATALEYASKKHGVMHACGHDMHAAILFGTLQRLAEKRDFNGTIFGVFQPGEELVPGGASKVLAEGPFEGYDVVAVIANHVDSTLEVGEIGLCNGAFMASNDELRFRVTGRGGHGAMREKIDDSVAAAANIVVKANKLNDSKTVLSIGKIVADGATNIIPDSVYMEGTMRTFDGTRRERVWSELESIVKVVDANWGTKTELIISHGYPTVTNNIALTQVARVLAQESFKAVELSKRYTAEDFGFFTEVYPSVFYRLGVGSSSGASHTDSFAPDERAIDVGIDFMTALTYRV